MTPYQHGKVKVYVGKSDAAIDITQHIAGSWTRGAALNVLRLRPVTKAGPLGLSATAAGMRLNLTCNVRLVSATKPLAGGGEWIVWIEDSNPGTPDVVAFPAVITARPINTPDGGAVALSLNAIQTKAGAVYGQRKASGSQKTSGTLVGYQRTGTSKIAALTTTAVTASASNPVVLAEPWE